MASQPLCVKYVYSCYSSSLQFQQVPTTLIRSTCLLNLLVESSAKPSLGCHFGSPGLVWQKIQQPLTLGANVLGVVGVNNKARHQALKIREQLAIPNKTCLEINNIKNNIKIISYNIDSMVMQTCHSKLFYFLDMRTICIDM